MKLKEITVGKEFKIGMPNYSNLTLTCQMTFEVAPDEKPDMDAMWDAVNHQLYIQSSGIDDTWLVRKEYKNFFKTEVKIPKEVTS